MFWMESLCTGIKVEMLMLIRPNPNQMSLLPLLLDHSHLQCKMQWAHFPKKYFGLLLLTGVAYEGKVNAAELHFDSSFQGHPTCLSFFCMPPAYLPTCHLATWPPATWNLQERHLRKISFLTLVQLGKPPSKMTVSSQNLKKVI